MEYKVCILAAGANDQVRYAKDFNIALLPIGTKAALSHIIEKFPKDVEIVLAVGYNADLIKEFASIAYPDRKVTFVDVDNYDRKGSGPGYSLRACKKVLQCPFIFTSADTVVGESVPEPSSNWIGVGKVTDSSRYLMAEVDNGVVREFYVKVETDVLLRRVDNYKDILDHAFVGMAGIYDYAAFWQGLDVDQQLIKSQLQVSNGLQQLIHKSIRPVKFTWFDTGSESGYSYACRYFSKNETIIKPDEFLYFEGSKVIKYFADASVVAKRVKRADLLGSAVPRITFKGKNFYAYTFIEAQTLPQISDVAVFYRFLDFCKETIWQKRILDKEEQLQFSKMCSDFYEVKTRERVKKFFMETGIQDSEDIINSVKIPKTAELLDAVDWEELKKGVPVLYHGDLQPENILVGPQGFKLIDWRHDFAGNVEFGDLYYDFAKLHHALIITHEVIRKNEFDIKVNGQYITYNFMLKNNMLEYLKIFEQFLIKEGYDLQRVRVLSAITYLNIAPLHHYPYNIFLYYYGKDMLSRALEVSR